MIGKQFLHYRIVEKLGEGGMGVVYKAEDIKLRREVAIKFLPQHIAAHGEERERFKIEARAAAALNHPNIATIHTIEEADGEMFIVMEYIEGRELKELVKAEAITLQTANEYATQIASGLQAAHEKGIVHRDIKSTNIMITHKGQVKIMDFGLAKIGSRTQLTKDHSTLGTAAYMSPEQARGDKVDCRSDIWSCGVVLYETLTGSLPFKGDYEQAVLYSILNEEPEPIAQLRTDVPEEIAEIVHRALSKEPDERFSTANELLEALEPLRKTESIGRSLALLAGRPRFIVTGIALLIALIALVVFWQYRSTKVRWAHEQLAELEKLAVENNEAAFQLAKQVEEVIPNDPRLVKLWPSFSRFIFVASDPSGADVYRKEYSALNADWEYLGSTPIDSLRFPYGVSKLKLEMDGFQTVEVADVSRYGSDKKNYKLDAEGSIPPGMVRLPGSQIGLALPGLNHLKAEKLSDVFIDKFEVTNKAFKKFVDDGGYRKKEYWKHRFAKDGKTLSWEEAMTYFKDKTGRPGPVTWEVGDYPTGQESYPVMGVSWYEAAAYAEFAGKNLPTIFHWNSAAGTPQSFAIVPLSNFGEGPTPVGSHEGMNRGGTYDMAGNVREWCWNESDRPEQRFILGGGWNDPAYSFNDAFTQNAFDRSPTNGFRCIKYISQDDNLAAITRRIRLPFRDFLSEKQVSDEIFEIFLNMYDYDKTELNVKQESIDDSGDDAIEEIVSFDAAYGNERVTAHLYLPRKGSAPYQTVIIFPGSEVIHSTDTGPIQLYRGKHCDFILKSGRAIMLPIYKGTLTRGDELDSDYPDETNFWKEHVIAWVKDFSRSIDYLETRPDIDSQRLAYYGGSWGAALGAIIPAVESRVKASVLSNGGFYFQKSLPEVDAIHYVSRVEIPVLMLNGKYDQYYPMETSQKPMFQLLGTPAEHKRYVLHETGHFVPRAVKVKETLDWLDKYLGNVD